MFSADCERNVLSCIVLLTIRTIAAPILLFLMPLLNANDVFVFNILNTAASQEVGLNLDRDPTVCMCSAPCTYVSPPTVHRTVGAH